MSSIPLPPPDPDDTARIARAASAGDEHEFNRLYERLAPALLTWAELRVGPKLRPWLDPMDLVQEVWFRSLRAFDSFDPEQVSFRYWLFRVAKNALLEALRRSDSPGYANLGGGTRSRMFALRQVPDTVTAVSLRAVRGEASVRLRRWLQELDENDRDLVVHLGLEGMKSTQVAVMLELEPKTVAKRWQRLRERLETQGALREMLDT